ncbi:hypothetical protein BX600DRAFT_390517 [Xylariales sp. PMI_506]|nr:hypothetical protein BX600DRAFT_390517 [Xylariales sp. PMI_506]
MAPREEFVTYSQFACIGAGFSGIALGATLTRWYGISDVQFFERHSDLGGTWHTNKYPGCACDVPSILYSYSFAPNPNWTRILPSSDELWQYLNDVAAQYDLRPRMSFGVQVESAMWIESQCCWRLTLRHLQTNRVYLHESQFLFAGTGQLVTPRELDVPGLANFKGEVVHSSRWTQHDKVDDKNVVLFGNGCTAAQIVPSIVGQTASLTQIVRSKHWILPPVDAAVPHWLRFLLRNVPGLISLSRLLVFLAAENELRGLPLTPGAARFRARRRRVAEQYMRQAAPEKYHDLLIPDFEIGCKRRIFDSGYLRSLHAENLTLTGSKPTEIVADGVEMEDGSVVKADMLILANGFITNHFMSGINIHGRKGITLEEHWKSFGGAEAYNCSVMSDFPNFFILLGPNAATGHTSAVIAAENSVNYALRIIKPILEGRATVAELKYEAEQRYVDEIQGTLKETVWFSGCSSWYVRSVPGAKIWNAMCYPWSQGYFWYRSLFPTWSDWRYSVSLSFQMVVNRNF